MKKSAVSLTVAIVAALVMAVTAAAGSTYWESISGTELPNATNTEGQFVGAATGSYDGAWYIDVKHQDLSYHPASITGGTFRLDTFVGGRPAAITGAFVGGTVSQIGGLSGCTNQKYAVQGILGGVGINGGAGSGSFSATLTHYRTNVWFLGCVIYAASVKGTVSLTF